MQDVREVYEMVTQQTPPKPDALERQRKRQMRHAMNRKLGALAVAAVIAGLAILAVPALVGDGGQAPPASTGNGPAVTVPGAPGVDYVIDLDTGVMRRLPKAIIRSLGQVRFQGQYAASPDGSLLAYVGPIDEQGDSQIFIAGIDGTGVRQVTHVPNGASSPAWSPDGTRIAYEGLDSGHVQRLYVLDVASGESTQVSGVNRAYVRASDQSLLPHQPLEPQFTPDGSSLVYTGGSVRHPVIRTVPVTGGTSTLLIGPSGNLRDAENGSVSPDGSLVTFLGNQVGGPGPQRWVANADGTERRLLPDVYGIPCLSDPAGTWSADGSRIVCAEASRIIVVDVATGGATPVAIGRGAIWLTDHTLLVST